MSEETQERGQGDVVEETPEQPVKRKRGRPAGSKPIETDLGHFPEATRNTRMAALPALMQQGLSHRQIAQIFGVTPRTISRDMGDAREAIPVVQSVLQRMAAKVGEIMPAELRVEKYVAAVEIGLESKNISGAIQALGRLDAIEGVVTDGERLRSKYAEDTDPRRAAPIFQIAGNVNVTVELPREDGFREPPIETEAVDVQEQDESSQEGENA
jgi:transcriptional regulator with XRE-family HTH domain